MNDIANRKEKAALFFRYAMHYGLQLGIIVFLVMITGIRYILSGSFAGIFMVLLIVVPFKLHRYMKKYREDVLTNQITYAQAWSFGNITFFFASLISAMGIYLFFEYFSPGSLTAINKHFHDMLMKVSQQDIPLVDTPAIEYAVNSIMSLCAGGMILSAIVAGFVKKKPNPQTLNT